MASFRSSSRIAFSGNFSMDLSKLVASTGAALCRDLCVVVAKFLTSRRLSRLNVPRMLFAVKPVKLSARCMLNIALCIGLFATCLSQAF